MAPLVKGVSRTRFQVEGRVGTRIWSRKELGVSEEQPKKPECT